MTPLKSTLLQMLENKLTANENHLQNSDVKHVKNGKKIPF